MLSEIDPVLHHAVETGGTYDLNARRPRYFTVNGREFPDTIQDNGTGLQPNQPYGALVRLQPNTAANTQPALIRMINAGLLNHPFHPHGNHTTEIAQDGRVVPPTEHFGETIGSGQTLDYLIRWDDVDQWNPASNPLPVAQPNYRNLTFKDGNTFYSGSPYLGYKGTLPTGTVSQNVCGEWYFPWHSHALNEFTNFDEGFGGMATLLRVDPAGGCFGAPTATAIVGGTLKGGTFAALTADDTAYYQVNPKTTTTTDRDDRRADHDHGRLGRRLPDQRELLHPHRQRGPAGHRRAGHDDLDGVARAARDRGGVPRQRRRGDGAGERLVRDLQRGPGRRGEPQGDLQGQELLEHDGHHLCGPHDQRPAADGQDLQLDDRGAAGCSSGDVGRMGHPAGATGAAAGRRLDGRQLHVDAARFGAAPTSAPGRTRERSASSCTPSGGRHRHRRPSRPGATS